MRNHKTIVYLRSVIFSLLILFSDNFKGGKNNGNSESNYLYNEFDDT